MYFIIIFHPLKFDKTLARRLDCSVVTLDVEIDQWHASCCRPLEYQIHPEDELIPRSSQEIVEMRCIAA